MLFLDFWGDNPFADLDLPFPPVPTEQEVRKKINKKKDACNNQLRRLKDKKDDESKEQVKKLNQEVRELQELQKKVAVKVRELAVALPFDTLLAVQPIAPLVFSDKTARSAVIEQAWRDLVGADAVALSETRRRGFDKDFTRNALLDDEEGFGGAANGEAANDKGDDHDA